MRFTQAQVRQLVGIGEETFRAWRKALAPLHGRVGHAPNFSAGDVVALVAVEWMVRSLGVKIGHLEKVAPSLFAACEKITPISAHSSYVVILREEAKVITYRDLISRLDEGGIVIPASRLLNRINAAMVEPAENAQGYLPFPLTAA